MAGGQARLSHSLSGPLPRWDRAAWSPLIALWCCKPKTNCDAEAGACVCASGHTVTRRFLLPKEPHNRMLPFPQDQGSTQGSLDSWNIVMFWISDPLLVTCPVSQESGNLCHSCCVTMLRLLLCLCGARLPGNPPPTCWHWQHSLLPGYPPLGSTHG